jgi:nucleoside-diphosphate-sugar epimerase
LDHFGSILTVMMHVAIFGAAGTIGPFVGAELDRRGIPFRVVGRTRGRLEQAFGSLRQAEIFPADIGDPRSAAAAARDVDTIIYAVGLPYPSHSLHPKLMRTAVEAAAAMRVSRLALVSSVYAYGVPQTRVVSETHPRQPASRKGQYRKEQEDIVLEADAKGTLRGLIVRLPDFYGPHADNSLANPILRAALQGKTATWPGPATAVHEFAFVPDTGPVITELASREECYGEAWNFAGPGAIAAAEFIQKAYVAAGRQPKFRVVGRGMLRVIGWFNRDLQEFREMMYLQETPVLLDDSKLAAKLGGLKKTSYDEGIRKTLEWMAAQPRG